MNRRTFISLDPYHFWEPFNRLPFRKKTADKAKVGIRMMIMDMVKLYFLGGKTGPEHTVPEIDRPVVICVDSINQQEALLPIIRHLGARAFLISGNAEIVPGMPHPNELKKWSKPYALHRLLWNFTLGKYQRAVYQKRFYEYHGHLGAYRFWRKAFKKGSAKYFIAANDHSGLCPIGFAAAKSAGLKTIYITHATISEYFPPLRADHALLDGEDAKRKYLAAGPTKTEIHLVGTMKYDEHLKSSEVEAPGRHVGVCLGWNNLTDIPANIALCEKLEGENLPFIVRFHPAVGTDTRKLFSERGWDISPPESENPLDFVLRCHTVVSSDSSILLEALVLKRRPLNFASDGVTHDYYGYVKSGLVDRVCHRPDEVMKALSEDFDLEKHRRVAKWYCDTLYSPDEGQSTAKVLKILNEIIT